MALRLSPWPWRRRLKEKQDHKRWCNGEKGIHSVNQHCWARKVDPQTLIHKTLYALIAQICNTIIDSVFQPKQIVVSLFIEVRIKKTNNTKFTFLCFLKQNPTKMSSLSSVPQLMLVNWFRCFSTHMEFRQGKVFSPCCKGNTALTVWHPSIESIKKAYIEIMSC